MKLKFGLRKEGIYLCKKNKNMENSFNLGYQKQLFNVVQKIVDLKKSILTEIFLLANSGKEKKIDTPLGKLYFLKRKQQKLEDVNIKEAITLIKKIDEIIVRLEQNLDLKNEFLKDVFDEEDYLCVEPKATLKEN
jgi:hypothetical protein